MGRQQRCIGIVREVYNKWERRAPLTPTHVQQLVKKGVRVLVEPSDRRIFRDSEYTAAGAEVTPDLSPAKVIFGVKQVPIEKLLSDRTYVFFSHTIKGQPANMPLLDAILKKNIRLMDYEIITETGLRNGRRLIAFGGWAGRAGMINTLRGVGERLLALGCSSPFLNVGSAYMYPSLEVACEAVSRLGDSIKKHGVPSQFAPMNFVFTGDGNVSRGAQEVFDHLPHVMVDPKDLHKLPKDTHTLYGCVAKEEHMVRRRDGGAFDLSEYYVKPELYEGVFHNDILPHASVIVNAMYWDERYPRLVTLDQYDALRATGNNKLMAVADISCDIGGSIEMLRKDTYIEQPFFRYDPATREADDVIDGDGLLMMGVDILPSELPRESSAFFGDKLMDFVDDLVNSDMSKEGRDLPAPLAGAIVASGGQLTKEYEYIGKMKQECLRKSSKTMEASAGSTVINLRGHLFDTKLINRVLDLIEEDGGVFYIVKTGALPIHNYHGIFTEAHIQLSVPGGRSGLDATIEKIKSLIASVPEAEAIMEEMEGYCSGNFSATVKVLMESRAAAEKAERYAHEKDEAGHSASGSVSAAPSREILVLGAGLVAGPCVEYLSRDHNDKVVVASAKVQEAKDLVRRVGRGRQNLEAIELDALGEPEKLMEQIKRASVVISLLPATMHIGVGKACIEHKIPFCNASYVSEEMRGLDAAAKEAGVPILCEMGLDPGMDHMSAQKVIDEVAAEGGKVTSFSSICGGLPAPEAADNPLAYKFSWSPKGVLNAARNPSRWLQDGQVVEVKGEDLLRSAEPQYFLPSLALECLPNRDALPYKDVYQIQEAKSVFRGTLRYRGWSDVMYCFRLLGLMDDTATPAASTWPALMEALSLPSEAHAADTLASKEGVSKDTAQRAAKCLSWLGVWRDATPLDAAAPMLVDTFCSLLQHKLPFAEGERDMAVMHHTFGVDRPDGKKENRTSTLVAYGSDKPDGDTIMAKTVGLTVGIGARMLLDGTTNRVGVLLPVTPDLYSRGLDLLEREGITFKEETIVD